MMIFRSLILLTCLMMLCGCELVRELTAVRDLDYRASHVSNVSLAGVDLMRFRDGIPLAESARIGLALRRGTLPLAFTLHLDASNPSAASSNARFVKMDWTLLLRGTETVSGTFEEAVVIAPGQTADLPLRLQFDLTRHFGSRLESLIDAGLAVVGGGGITQDVTLRFTPTINTGFGSVTAAQPITVSLRP